MKYNKKETTEFMKREDEKEITEFTKSKNEKRDNLKQIFSPPTFFHLIWFLWHINHFRLFNAKSILIQINSSISNNSVWYK